jgi:TonB family protein
MKRLNTAALFATLAFCGHAMAADKPKQLVVDFDSCAKPEWPAEDFKAGHTGTVRLEFTVDKDGVVKDSAILKSSGYPGLDEAARTGIAKCRFKNGPGKAPLQYVWTLE